MNEKKKLNISLMDGFIDMHRHSENGIFVKKESMDFFNRIFDAMDILVPGDSDQMRLIWMEVPRGPITSWLTLEDAQDCYGNYDLTEEEWKRLWKEEFPLESDWYLVRTSRYKENRYLTIWIRPGTWALFTDDKRSDNDRFENVNYFMEPLCEHIEKLMGEVAEDVDKFNDYVEENLPKQKRQGSIPRKELNRIVPHIKFDLEESDKLILALKECTDYHGEPFDKMTIRQYCKWWRVADEAYDDFCKKIGLREEGKERKGAAMDDVEYYKYHKFQTLEGLDPDSEEDFKKFQEISHYGELGFSRMNVGATQHYTPGKWLITFSISYSAYIEDGAVITRALYDAGAPLKMYNAEKIISALEATDNVLLTDRTFHDYLNHHEEGSVYRLPYEYECGEGKDYPITVGQLREIIANAKWEEAGKVELLKDKK